MEKQIQNECQKVIKQLIKIPDAEPFRHPVDYKALQLLDYPNIIKNPMDLGTIETNLKQKKYKTHKEFLDDIQLVWNNCKLYNQDGSSIYQIALNMEKAMVNIKNTFLTTINKLTAQTQQLTSSNPQASTVKPKKDKSNNSSLIKKKISKNKEGNSIITCNTNTNNASYVASNNATQTQPSQTTQSQKKDRNVVPNKGDQQTDKYTNQQERKYAHISLRLVLAFKLRNATEDKLVNLFSMLAEKHPETLNNIENREQKLSMNLTLLSDQIIQNMIAALEFKD